MKKGGDESDETEETTVLGGIVGKEVVGHEGEGEFHAGEEEEEGEVGEVKEEVGVCALDCGRFGGGWCGCWFLLLFGFGAADLSAGGFSLLGQRGERLGQTEVEVERLDDDQSQRDASGCREGVGGHGTEGTQPGAQRRAESEGDGEAGADEGHGRAALGRVRDVGCDGRGQLDVALGETADDARGEEGAEVGGHDPEENGEDIARHAEEEGGTAPIAIGEVADYGGGDGLEETGRASSLARSMD